MNLKEKEEKQQKQKLSKQLEQEQNQRNGHHMEDFQWGGGREEWGEKLQGRRSIIGRHKIYGKRSNGVGNRELIELTGTTHGHELRGRMLEGWGCRWRGEKRGEIGKTVIA